MVQKEEKRKQNDSEDTGQKSKKTKEAFIYGNYRYYYGYRLDKNSKQDPRLLAFKKEWFEGKNCLDIGCNQGLITIQIASTFSCRNILGIDIDGGLIQCAKQNLWKISQKKIVNRSDVFNVEHGSQKNFSLLSKEEKFESSESVYYSNGYDLRKRVLFRRENFVEDLGCDVEKYDTVLCLSVSKWIHLNWGDDGLITFFVKVWQILRPGGIFLFEPQPWESYQKNNRVSEIARANFRNILFTPDVFQEMLLDKIGFRYVENVTEKLPDTVAGFERPIFSFTK
ncbi:putative RNA methyltransferase [Zostera marina]|uniref:RNA methyltransferase n=1 Tax=Zostera marina TaxID=29655 RepID=A0A0K9PWZ6_ZOSMR|nr:putative RNA methyltransferase [Zostera marina]